MKFSRTAACAALILALIGTGANVSAHAAGGTSLVASSVRAAKKLSAATPKITGAIKVGKKLGIKRGAWMSGTKFSYQWYASGKAIKGATKSSYTLTAAQLGKKITVKVTGKKKGRAKVTRTSKSSAKVALGALSYGTPTISGPVQVGGKLTTNPGTWTKGTKFTYQWHASGVAIKGATFSTYKLTAAELGKNISLTVTGTQIGYSSKTRRSESTGAVVAATLESDEPSVSGEMVVGTQLKVDEGVWTSGTVFAYQWLADGAPLAGQTVRTLVLTEAHAGRYISVRVTGRKTGYRAATAESAWSSAVRSASNSSPTSEPSSPPSVYYKNCSAARAAGAAPIRRGQPGYGPHLDRDGDGIACE